MRTIIIPGYSHKNKEWADNVAQNLPDSEVYEWKHWSDPNIKFSPKDEAKNIADLKPINIVAKSIGTMVAMIILKDSIASLQNDSSTSFRAGKIILCGVPLNDLNEDDKYNYKILSDFPAEKIVVFQNTEDEHGRFEEVRNFLSQIN